MRSLLAIVALFCLSVPALADGHMDENGICWAEACKTVWVHEMTPGPNGQKTCVQKRVFYKVPVDCPECKCDYCHKPGCGGSCHQLPPGHPPVHHPPVHHPPKCYSGVCETKHRWRPFSWLCRHHGCYH